MCASFLVAQEQREAADRSSGEKSSKSDPSLVDLLLSDEDRELLRAGSHAEMLADRLPTIDDERTAVLGIRKLEGKHLKLYTDIPSRPAIDELCRVFDKAVPLWCDYFGVAESRVADWQLTGYLIQDKQRHLDAKLFPPNLPPFLHGFQRGMEIWVYDQPSDYYRRHLLLHEGVHGFMMKFLGGTGPPWYREGMAELLATHRWQNHQLEIGIMPKDREEVPYWGRIKILQQEYAAGREMMLRQVMRFDETAHLRLVPYAWCWAAAAFLDGHPVYRNRFRMLGAKATDSTAFFTRDFEAQFAGKLRELDEEWQLFIINLDYGYDLSRNAVQFAPSVQEPGVEGQSVSIAANRGWQATGLKLIEGRTYQITAQGRFRLRQEPPWWSEPGGITLHYWKGHPIGMLVGNIRLDQPLPGTTTLGNPIPIGLNRRIVAVGTGTLYLKVNDRPESLSDNVGQVTVKVVEDRQNEGRSSPEPRESLESELFESDR